MRRLFLTLGVMVAICIILISFGRNTTQIRRSISQLDSIPSFLYPHSKGSLPSLQVPASVKSTFEASGFVLANVTESREIIGAEGKFYEFIIRVKDDKWHLKYNENGVLLDSSKLDSINDYKLLPQPGNAIPEK